MDKQLPAVINKEIAITEFFETLTKILKSLQPVIEHAVKEYLQQTKRRA